MSDPVEETRPSAPSWMDKDFFQTALRSGDGDPSITVLDINTKFANAVGENFCSDMYRVSVELQRDKNLRETRSLIVKCQPRGGMTEEIIVNAKFFDTEIKMLTKVLPEMQRMLDRVAPGKYQPFGAKCFYHGLHPLQFIVLEDLSPLGFKLANKCQGLDYNHGVLALTDLARFHATSIALLTKDPSLMKPFCGNPYLAGRKGFETIIKSSIRAFASEIKTWPGYEMYSDVLKKLEGSTFDRLVKLNSFNEGGFNVLTHGDFWINNMMFRYFGDSVTDIKLIDLQFSHWSSPAIDLHYFMQTSLSEEVHTHHFGQLVKEYHTELIGTLDLLGCSNSKISLQQLEKELDDYGFYAVYSAVHVLPIALADGYNIETAFHDSEDKPGSNTHVYSSTTFVHILKRLLPKFQSKGWL